MESSFFADKCMKALQHSLYYKIDGSTSLRERFLELADKQCNNSADAFFYDMIPAIRFLYKTDDIAYTDRDKMIWMGIPNSKIVGAEEWEFIFCHECLHQLWDTFGAEDELKKLTRELGLPPFDHDLLNVASDCVINDFLLELRKKKRPSIGIFPDVIYNVFGVTYDRYVDDQISLYLKLIKSSKYSAQKSEQLNTESGGKDEEKDKGENQSSGGNGEGKNSDGGDEENMGGENGEGAGEGTGNEDGENGTGSGGSSDGDGDDETKPDGKSTRAYGATADNKGESGNKGKNNSWSSGRVGKQESGDLSRIEKDCREYVNAVMKQYGKETAGQLGSFISKCKQIKQTCQKLRQKTRESSGIVVGTYRKGEMTLRAVKKAIMTSLTSKVRKFDKVSSYKKLKKGTGFVKMGQPIEKGRINKQKHIPINVAFYVDKSGSMSGVAIENVISFVNGMADEIEKQFRGSKSKFDFWAFDTKFYKFERKTMINAAGNNVDFDELIERMKDESGDYLMNVIITDGGFEFKVNEICRILKDFNGMIFLIVNHNSDESKFAEIEKQVKNFKYMICQSDFKE